MDESEEAYLFLENFSTDLIDQLYATSLIEPRWTLLTYKHYAYEPSVPITFDSLAEFIECAPLLVDLAERYRELLDAAQPVRHDKSLREVIALFDAQLVPREAIPLLRYSEEVASYHHFFIQCFLRVYFFESLEELREWYAREKEPSLEELLEDMEL